MRGKCHITAIIIMMPAAFINKFSFKIHAAITE
jgi:hypothetical protein